MLSIDMMNAVSEAQDRILDHLQFVAPEGGIWTRERLAAAVGCDQATYDIAEAGLIVQQRVEVDDSDITLIR